MVAKPLLPPPPDFAALALPFEKVEPASLFRVSRHDSGEPYFASSRAQRFDAPPGMSYGTAYFGLTLLVAMGETILHDLEPVGGHFHVAPEELEMRYALSFKRGARRPLKLANLTGPELKRLGGHAELSGTSDYKLTQTWSGAVYSHPETVDGFIYISRHINTELAVVLFDRASDAIALAKHNVLIDHPHFDVAARKLGIRSI